MIYSAPFNPLPFQGACPLATPWPTIVLADGARRRLPAVACRLCRGRGQCVRAVGPGDIDILDAAARAPRAWVGRQPQPAPGLPVAAQLRAGAAAGRGQGPGSLPDVAGLVPARDPRSALRPAVLPAPHLPQAVAKLPRSSAPAATALSSPAISLLPRRLASLPSPGTRRRRLCR